MALVAAHLNALDKRAYSENSHVVIKLLIVFNKRSFLTFHIFGRWFSCITGQHKTCARCPFKIRSYIFLNLWCFDPSQPLYTIVLNRLPVRKKTEHLHSLSSKLFEA